MKTLAKLVLAAVLFATAFTAQAGTVRGHYRSNGTYVAPHYRSNSGSFGSGYSGGSSSGYKHQNPFAAYPSVSVDGYRRQSGTYVLPHVRTPANDTVTDNLSYRGFGTIRMLRY